MKSEYQWPYLMPKSDDGTTYRGRRLWRILEPYLHGIKSVLDLNCGFSPLFPHFHRAGVEKFTGIDLSLECIDWLKQHHPPEGMINDVVWLNLSDADFAKVYEEDPTSYAHELVMLLGMCDGSKPYDSSTELKSLMKIVDASNPSVVVIEFADRVNDRATKAARELLEENYICKLERPYRAGFETNGDRRVLVYERKTWQS